jgi:hypothetical protein
MQDTGTAAGPQYTASFFQEVDRMLAMKDVEKQHDIDAFVRKACAFEDHVSQHWPHIRQTFRARFHSQCVEQRLFDVDRDHVAARAARGSQREGAVTSADIHNRTICAIQP